MAALPVSPPKFPVKLIERRQVAEGTYAFRFAKPPDFAFKPGQYVDVTLLDPPRTDSAGNLRSFSIASAPYQDWVAIVTRMRNTAFKTVLRELRLGTEVLMEGPMGSFTLHRKPAKPAVLLAGGIGITPFLSMLRQASRDKLSNQIYLFYSNRRPEDAAFLEELRELETSNSNFHFIPTMTQMNRSHVPWGGETGYVRAELLRKHLAALRGPTYYAAGPPPMVGAMRQMLAAAGVDEDDIRTEDFAGY